MTVERPVRDAFEDVAARESGPERFRRAVKSPPCGGGCDAARN